MSPLAPTTATLAVARSMPSLGAFSSTWRQITQAVWVLPVVKRCQSRAVALTRSSLSRLKSSKMIEVKPPRAVMSMPLFWANSMALITLRLAVLKRRSISGTNTESM